MKLKDLLVRMQYILKDLELTEELLDTNKLKAASTVSLQVNIRIEKINDDLNSLVDLLNKIDIKANDINRKMKLIRFGTRVMMYI